MENQSFQMLLQSELSKFQVNHKEVHPSNELLRIDLHCHDHNSNVPDELMGRILNVPETWLPTDQLIHTLKKHGSDAYTITNHNNARSCFELLDKGFDVLVGAEFSCFVPDFETGIHVLTYGFTPSQEIKLNKFRKNIYAFLEYCVSEDIPTIWAHPLYYYKSNGRPPLEFFDNMALLFERFEVINGQRDTWQNLLVNKWVEGLTNEKIDMLSTQTGLNPGMFCKDPYKKSISGGSDSHMGIFCGLTGTNLYVPDLDEKRISSPVSLLALQAIREGKMIPFGSHHSYEKMTVTFLDYLCQIAINGKDPGLMRILLHKGTINDKIIALLISNGFAELRKHKVTMSFINQFHECFTGNYPHFTKRWFTPRVYKPVFDETRKIADAFNSEAESMISSFTGSINSVYQQLVSVLTSRLQSKLDSSKSKELLEHLNLNDLLNQLEFPSEIRGYISGSRNRLDKSRPDILSPDIPKFLDGLSFPFLAATVMLSAHFTAAHVMYKARPLLNDFSERINYLQHPKRLMWLTDTYGDSNGVSSVLKSMLKQIQQQNLPIDLVICSGTIKPEKNLVVLRPVSEFSLSFYKQQTLRIPDFLELNRLFMEGGYDRIMSSTEGPMGLSALYLKHAYTVPAYFYIHTDWITFGQKVLQMDKQMSERFRRISRAFYKKFDGVFVLNKDQHKWMTGKKMEINSDSVFLTAHWAEAWFKPTKSSKAKLFGLEDSDPVLLFAGRISLEKGVMELPQILRTIREELPDVKMVIAGEGPAEEDLRKLLPDATYLGWVSPSNLAEIYSAADLLLLPSRFDTFSCAVLEALSCGLPVIAYNSKGPKDIIQNGINGFIVKNQGNFASRILEFLKSKEMQKIFRKAASVRAKDYTADRIIWQLMSDLGLPNTALRSDE
ncbi:MAG: glycosyltransferase [Bacteroidetes bacterium]|nr:glycosyltransferase [Bacteroidota bacterium]